jgi:hypothetical protein
MKFIADRPLADPEIAARKIREIANTVEPIQDGRIHIEKTTGRSCSRRVAARPNMAPGSPSPSRRVGCGVTNPAPM